MQILTKESLDTAIKMCQENERYRVVIVTECAIDHNPILDYLSQIEDVNIVRCFGNPWVKFLNRSIINMISVPHDVMLGARADCVLCSPSVYENEEIKPILQTMEMRNINFNLKNEL